MGPEFVYGFLSALRRIEVENIYPNDIKIEALDAVLTRIKGDLSRD